MRQVRVVLEHDGSGDKAVPIAVIEVDPRSPDDDWRITQWLEAHDWFQIGVGDAWIKKVKGLYVSETKHAVISDTIYLEEMR